VTERTPYRATVVDAGVGNLANLARALRHLGAEAEVTADPERVAAARCLVLPGVGAFAPPRERLRESGLEEALRAALDGGDGHDGDSGGAWLLGVCVGFQLLFEESEEFGRTAGLGLLAGRVTALPDGVPSPHIGWNALHGLAPHPLFSLSRAVAEGSHVYFVHGYAVDGAPEDEVLARATHGRAFPAVAGRGRVLGTQFHPEKSGPVGLAILANYLEMAHGAVARD
jgi:glutamine amidotransferase